MGNFLNELINKLDLFDETRKYLLWVYILGVLTHTTAHHWSLRVTQDAYFSLLTHTKQLLLVTFCDAFVGI